MTHTEAIAAITQHLTAGESAHTRWIDQTAAMSILDQRLAAARLAGAMDGSPPDPSMRARRLLQLAGMCVRFVSDFDLVQSGTAKT